MTKKDAYEYLELGTAYMDGQEYDFLNIKLDKPEKNINYINISNKNIDEIERIISIFKNNIEKYNSLMLPQYDLEYYELLTHAKGSSKVIFEEEEHGERYHFPDPFKFELHPYSFKADDSWIMDMEMASKTKWRVV